MYMKKQRWLPPTSIDAARESSAAFEGLSNNAHYGLWLDTQLSGRSLKRDNIWPTAEHG